jgi:hypothetical protein
MSETDIKAAPPLNAWLPAAESYPGEGSVSRMVTVLETIRVTALPDGGREVLIHRGAAEIFGVRLDRASACHLAALLSGNQPGEME